MEDKVLPTPRSMKLLLQGKEYYTLKIFDWTNEVEMRYKKHQKIIALILN